MVLAQTALLYFPSLLLACPPHFCNTCSPFWLSTQRAVDENKPEMLLSSLIYLHMYIITWLKCNDTSPYLLPILVVSPYMDDPCPELLPHSSLTLKHEELSPPPYSNMYPSPPVSEYDLSPNHSPVAHTPTQVMMPPQMHCTEPTQVIFIAQEKNLN